MFLLPRLWSLRRPLLACGLVSLCGLLPALGSLETAGQAHLSAEALAPGDALAVVLESRRDRSIDSAVIVDGAGRTLAKAASFNLDTALIAAQAVVLGIPTTASSGNAYLKLNLSDGSAETHPLYIKPRTFVTEVIGLDQTNTAIRNGQPAQRSAEADELLRLLAAPPAPLAADEAFVYPVAEKRRTAFFGDRRTYYYSDGVNSTTIHAGIDFGVPSGTAVSASASGRVVFAASRQVSGLTVVLDHGAGIFSLYFHLKSIDVAVDDYVRAGSRLGLSGATGLATGPHLHWEIRVAGEAVDPDGFVGAHAVTVFLRSFGARAAAAPVLSR